MIFRSGESCFRTRLQDRLPLVGTFIKTPSPHVVEIVGQSGFDFLVIDQEHAPFDRMATDLAILAARAMSIPALVRVPASGAILGALDDGADGVIVPHVASAAAARAIAVSCRYEGGGRGYSNAPRAGRYGATAMVNHVANEDARVATIVMIEDARAVTQIDDIVAVEGVKGPVVVHAVQHTSHRPIELQDWPDADRTSRLVFITRGIGRAEVENLLTAVAAVAPQ